MIKIKINGIEYSNVSTITPSVVYDFYYDVKTMDGKKHRDIKGKRTNYSAVFYNDNLESYDRLKNMLLESETVDLEIPNGAKSTISGEYLVTVNSDELRGKMWTGNYYNTLLAVSFEKVGYDE